MQNLITVFTTPNEFLCNVLTFPLIFIEIFVYYFLVKSIYNIQLTKKALIAYLLSYTILGTIIRLIIPLPFSFIINAVFYIILTKYFSKLKLYKCIISQCIFLISVALMEYVINIFVTKSLNLDIYFASSIPIFKLLFSAAVYLGILGIFTLIKFLKLNLNISDNTTKKERFIVIFTILIIIFIVYPNIIFLILIDMEIPTYYIIYNIVCSIIFLFISTYNTYKFNKAFITSRELETANLYNKTLSKLVDSNRAFKHDINNIIQAIGGYIKLNDIDGLTKYYETGLLPEIQKVNNLSLLNPEVINSPPIFGLFLGKYNYADSKDVKINLISFFDYSTINMAIFDFVKILGILLDNAIEAASLCDDRFVEIHISIDFYNRQQIFSIKNTYSNKDISINEIFKKDFSTKQKKSGFGLWEIKELIKKYNNVQLQTSKTDKYFIQKLNIKF